MHLHVVEHAAALFQVEGLHGELEAAHVRPDAAHGVVALGVVPVRRRVLGRRQAERRTVDQPAASKASHVLQNATKREKDNVISTVLPFTRT